MQKLIETQFFCYPKNKNLSILYADKSYLSSRLFKALSFQISPKEGVLLRFRKTVIGHFLSALNQKNSIVLKIPKNRNLKLAYQNNNKTIFFEFDSSDNPVNVLSENEVGVFEKSNFSGYSLIENYTKKEYFQKRVFIKKALEKRWNEIMQFKILHGDFTHFNILLSKEHKLHFIDSKKVQNSILFDHFYFYSYYVQCLEKCQTISARHVSEIITDLQKIIFNICKLEVNKKALDTIIVTEAAGLNVQERKKRVHEFANFLLNNEK